MTRRGPRLEVPLPDECRAAIEAAAAVTGADPARLFAPPRERSGPYGLLPNRARWAGFVALARRDGRCPVAVATDLQAFRRTCEARDALARVVRRAQPAGRGPLEADDPGVMAALALLGASDAPPLQDDPVRPRTVDPLRKEELSIIRARLRAGESPTAIARSMDRAPSTIKDLARKWGIGMPPAKPRSIARDVPRPPLAKPRSTARVFGRPATRWTDCSEAMA